MKIAILGSNGFIGNEIWLYFKNKGYEIIGINKENYDLYINQFFDIFINANGNSKKFWAEQNPKEDFEQSVSSVFNSLVNFKCKYYIYLSSLDCWETNIYGINKRIAEEIIYRYCIKFNYNYYILRLGSVVGKNMKKGVVYDILNNKPLYITLDSILRFIGVYEIPRLIEEYISNPIVLNEIINAAGNSIEVKEIIKVLNKEKILVSTEAKKQSYAIYPYVGDPILKSSEEYIKEILNGE